MSLSLQELELLLALEDLEGPDNLLDFIPRISPWYTRPEHLRPLAELFYRAEVYGGVRGLTSTPPQHGKTESILHWIARFLVRNPRKVVAYVTYESNLAYSKSKVCRNIAERAGLRLDPHSTAAREWRTPAGGGLIATGIGGPLTGQRVDLLIIDDPVKNRVEAESVTKQINAIEWARSTAFTRLSPGGSVIVNMARWSDGDLLGRLMKEKEISWERINLNAIQDEGTPTERALWEAGKPLAFLKEQRKLVGPYEWSALYEGQPQPRGGALFGPPSTYKLAEIAGARFAIACDPAASAATSADHSAVVVVAAVGDGAAQKVYVLEVWRGQVEIPALVEKLRYFQNRWRAPIFVEAQGGFKAVPQMLRMIGTKGPGNNQDALRIVDIAALGDKFTRALPAAAAWNDGRLLIPESDEPWKDTFVDEITRFTGRGDRQDDQVDALAHAFRAVDRRVHAIERGPRVLRGSMV